MLSIPEEELKQRFSLNMRCLMAEKSISEIVLSKITAISQSAINRIKNGQTCPSLYQALLISEALEKKIEDLLLEVSSSPTEPPSNYIPIFNANNLLEEKNKILGFVEQNRDWNKNSVGFKVDKTFDCKLLNHDSVVIAAIDEHPSYETGDTILFFLKGKYMIGTFQKGSVKPIDNLMKSLDLETLSILGKVISIETRYIKDKHLVSSILETINMEVIANLFKVATKSLHLHPV